MALDFVLGIAAAVIGLAISVWMIVVGRKDVAPFGVLLAVTGAMSLSTSLLDPGAARIGVLVLCLAIGAVAAFLAYRMATARKSNETTAQR